MKNLTLTLGCVFASLFGSLSANPGPNAEIPPAYQCEDKDQEGNQPSTLIFACEDKDDISPETTNEQENDSPANPKYIC